MADAAARDSRTVILARIRTALGSASATPAPLPPPSRPDARAGDASTSERVARFGELLERVGGRLHRARDEDEARARLAELVERLGAREVALSDDPLVRGLAALLPAGVTVFDGWSDRARLFACDLGISSAQAAVAETGTLVLRSASERHRLVSLVPPVHVALLRAGAIVSQLGEVLAAPGSDAAVTLVTGPSRTADIELELVIGVHGPRELHVIALEESCS